MQLDTIATQITSLHEECIINWKKDEVKLSQPDFLKPVEENHAFNYQLWHAEDKARRDDMGAEFVYQAKRRIDAFNQQRNDRMEQIDSWLFQTLQPASFEHCPVHSETPGMMIDRLSILALKAYHMQLQSLRTDTNATHRQTCHDKLAVIKEQRLQLQHCLQTLLNEVQDNTRTFRVYHQFKMYNDPTLNPELYRQAGR